jgi:hypothetical protein
MQKKEKLEQGKNLYKVLDLQKSERQKKLVKEKEDDYNYMRQYSVRLADEEKQRKEYFNKMHQIQSNSEIKASIVGKRMHKSLEELAKADEEKHLKAIEERNQRIEQQESIQREKVRR